MNENEKNPLLNMQRIMQESKELSEASASDMGDTVQEKKVKKEKTVNARLKHEQSNKRSTVQKKTKTLETTDEIKPVRKTATKKTKTANAKEAEGTVDETKKSRARYVGPTDKNVPS